MAIKCDVCGNIERDGRTLPPNWRTDDVQDLCSECFGKLTKEMEEFVKPMNEQTAQHAKEFLAKEVERYATS
jgi:hypothetical protein